MTFQTKQKKWDEGRNIFFSLTFMIDLIIFYTLKVPKNYSF